jgi:gas vesicle protein GvpK
MTRKPRRARRAVRRPTPRRAPRNAADPKAVTAAELRLLRRELERRMAPPRKAAHRSKRASRPAPMRWNPEPDDVQRSVAQLVLTIAEFLRRLMERQAIRRMEQRTLTPGQVEDVGLALMQLEKTIRDVGKRFGLSPEDLNLDLGPIGKLM